MIFIKKSTTPKKISTLLPTILVVLRYTVQSHSKSIFTYVDGTYEEEYSCWPPAICMIIISIAEIVLFCYDAAKGKTDATGPIAQIFIYNPHKRQEAWRFLTYMLVHVGWVCYLYLLPSYPYSLTSMIQICWTKYSIQTTVPSFHPSDAPPSKFPGTKIVISCKWPSL